VALLNIINMRLSAYTHIKQGGRLMVDIFKAFAEETRLRIFAQIIKGDMCVCEVEDCLKITQSNASRHLNALKKAGILDSYKLAQWTYYKVSANFMENNKDLYNYLVLNVNRLKTYDVDNENYGKCKTIDICSCKSVSEGKIK